MTKYPLVFGKARAYKIICEHPEHLELRRRYFERLGALKLAGQLYETKHASTSTTESTAAGQANAIDGRFSNASLQLCMVDRGETSRGQRGENVGLRASGGWENGSLRNLADSNHICQLGKRVAIFGQEKPGQDIY